MALKLYDRVRQYSNTAGAGDISLDTSIAGFQDFSGVFASGDKTYYAIEQSSEWEIGVGTFISTGLSRDTVLQSSNADSKIVLDGSQATIFVTYPADRALTYDWPEGDPRISFVGTGQNADSGIYLYTLGDGTLSFEGNEGQLFSIADNLTSGTIWSVNDSAGFPALSIDATGNVYANEYGGNFGIGTGYPTYVLDVNGTGRFAQGVVYPDSVVQVIAYTGQELAISGYTFNVSGNLQSDIDNLSGNLAGNIYGPNSGIAFFDGDTAQLTGVPSFTYDRTNKYLGINNATPEASLDIDTTGILFGRKANQPFILHLRGDSASANADIATIGVERYNYRPNQFSSSIVFQRGSATAGARILFKTQDTPSGLAERMRIDLDGDVGINETSPQAQLHITNRSSARPVLILEGQASQADNLQEWQDSSSNVLAWVNRVGDASFNSLTVTGDLYVTGNITSIGSTNVTILDKQFELASDSGTAISGDADVDQGGIVLKSTDGDKSWLWIDSTDAWTSNQNISAGGNNIFLGGYIQFGDSSQQTTAYTGTATNTGEIYSVAFFNSAGRLDSSTLAPQIDSNGDLVGTSRGVAFFAGSGAADSVVNGPDTIAIGREAAFQSSGNTIAIGYRAGYNSNAQLAIGEQAGKDITNTTDSIFIGTTAGNGAVDADDTVVVGRGAASSASGINRTTVVGYFAAEQGGGIANDFDGSVFVGRQAGYRLDGAAVNSVVIGNRAAYRSSGSYTDSVIIGALAHYQTDTAYRSTVVGRLAGNGASGSNNLFFGYGAGRGINGNYNIDINPDGPSPSPIGTNNNKINIAGVIRGDTSSQKLQAGATDSTFSPNAALEVISPLSTDITLITKGAASQTANLQEWRDSSDNVLLEIQDDGTLSGDNSTITIHSDVVLGTFNTDNVGYKLRFNGNNSNSKNAYMYHDGDNFRILYGTTNQGMYIGDSTHRWTNGIHNYGTPFTIHTNSGTALLGNEVFRVTDEERFGFRTTSPDGTVHIVQTADVYNSGLTIAQSSNGGSRGYIYQDGSSRLKFQVGTNTDQLVLRSNGFVGINTADPDCHLTVNGTGCFESGIRFGDSTVQTTAWSGINSVTGTPEYIGIFDSNGVLSTEAGYFYDPGNTQLDITRLITRSGLRIRTQRSGSNGLWVEGNLGSERLEVYTDDNSVWFQSYQDETINGSFGTMRFRLGSDPLHEPYFIVENYDSTNRALDIDISGGQVSINSSERSAALHITSQNPTDETLVLKGAVSQSANLQEWIDSSDTLLLSVDESGTIYKPGGTKTILTNDSAANANGFIPANDGFVIYYDQNFVSSNNDALVIEKTDFNGATPDGGMAFTNRGSDGIRELALYINGNNDIGVQNNSPSYELDVSGTINTNVGVRYPDGVTQVIAYTGVNGLATSGDVYQKPVRTVTTSDSFTTADSVILANAASNQIVLTLPSASTASGYLFTAKKIDTSVNHVILSGADGIDGVNTYDEIYHSYDSVTVISNGSAWYVI